MKISDIPPLRLANLQISQTNFKTPKDLVKYLGAVQSQDFFGAKWALGLRLPGSKDEEIEKAFNEGKILRTHALRPTWHFVAPEDIRWIMQLNAPQVKRILGYYNRKLDLDEKLFEKTNQIIKDALKGKNLTRPQLQSELKKHGITGTGQRIGHIIGWAELDLIICSGPRIGKQFSYGLVDEIAPNAKTFSRDEALSKLAKIFFQSRGPATIKDFSKWSGLPMADAKKGLDGVKSHFQNETTGGKDYYFASSSPIIHHKPYALLLPNYDEYISSYADYTIISDPETRANLEKIGNAVFWNHMVLGGKIVGSWRWVFKPKAVEIQLAPLINLTHEEKLAFEKTAKEYGRFLGLKVILV